MRTENSIKNVFISVVMSLVTILIGFISQKIFVVLLGTEYLGLNGLFSNILSILSVAELGFGTAIIYNLYKPIADKDYNKVNILINYYKKIYRIVAIIVFTLGIIVIPFIPYIVGDSTISHIRILFFLALLEVVFSYLLTYKRSILYADQKNYIVNIIHIFYFICLNFLQILFLYLTKNYFIYLIIKIICRILENIIINLYVNKKYLYLRNCKEELDEETKKDIKTKVNGLLYHNLGSVFVNGTDNILISKIFGIVSVGLCSNYYTIINSLSNLITQLFQSLTSSVGNLLIEDDKNKSYAIYKNMLFINFVIYLIASTCLLCGITTFIKIWMGNDFVLESGVIICIILCFYFQGMRKTNSVFKSAAGIFYEDRFIPIIESILNIFFSIVLSKIFGLPGIFLGTVISTLIVYFYSYPILVYKRIFARSYFNFVIDNFKYFLINFACMFITYICLHKIYFANLLVTFIIQIILCIVFDIIIIVVLYHRECEFKYFINILKKIKKVKKK